MVASKIPRTYREAMLSSNTTCWSKAVEEELSAMEKLHVWEMELIPGKKSLLVTVWVFCVSLRDNNVAQKASKCSLQIPLIFLIIFIYYCP
jgi:hypothetical protein